MRLLTSLERVGKTRHASANSKIDGRRHDDAFFTDVFHAAPDTRDRGSWITIEA